MSCLLTMSCYVINHIKITLLSSMITLSEHYDIAYGFAVYCACLKNLHIVYTSICVYIVYRHVNTNATQKI